MPARPPPPPAPDIVVLQTPYIPNGNIARRRELEFDDALALQPRTRESGAREFLLARRVIGQLACADLGRDAFRRLQRLAKGRCFRDVGQYSEVRALTMHQDGPQGRHHGLAVRVRRLIDEAQIRHALTVMAAVNRLIQTASKGLSPEIVLVFWPVPSNRRALALPWAGCGER